MEREQEEQKVRQVDMAQPRLNKEYWDSPDKVLGVLLEVDRDRNARADAVLAVAGRTLRTAGEIDRCFARVYELARTPAFAPTRE